MLAKNKSDQGLSPPVRCIPQPFILPLAIHLSIFVQIIHRLYTGADPGCLDWRFKFTKGGVRFVNFIRSSKSATDTCLVY